MFRDCEKESKKKYFSNTIPPLRLIPIKKEETSTPPPVIKKCVVKVKNILDLTNDGSQDLSAVPDIQIPAQSGSTTSTPKEDISFASWIAGKRAETASGKKSEVASENGSQTPSVSRTEGSSDPSTTLDVFGSGIRIQKLQNNVLAGIKPKQNREDRLNFIRYKTQVFFCFFIFLFFYY